MSVDYAAALRRYTDEDDAMRACAALVRRRPLFDLPPLPWPLGAGFGRHGARYRLELHPTTDEWVWWKAPDDARDGETIAEVMARHLAEAYAPAGLP